ncbi:MAG: hypothetical protein ABEI80_10715 [Haloplanus sp.]
MTTSNANSRDGPTVSESGSEQYRQPDEDRLDVVFEVLSDARRRRIIRILRTDEYRTPTVTALAEALASRESRDASADRLVGSLRHVHLPKLDAADVVEYAPDRSHVRYDDAPLVERLLDQL